MAFPMGIIADRKSRSGLAAIGIGLWSGVTICCGLAGNFIQLLLCRTGVGIGEAALTPSAYPLIRSLFSSRRLSTAIGIYSSGIYIGSGLAYWLGGRALMFIQTAHLMQRLHWVRFDWQLVFFVFGIPGMIVTIFIFLIKTPDAPVSKGEFNLGKFKSFLKEHHYQFLKLTMASALFNVGVYAVGVWLPTYLRRVQHLDVLFSGQILGMAMIFIAPVGAIAGGIIGDRMNSTGGIKGRITAIILSIVAVLICFGLLCIDLPHSIFLVPVLLLSILLSVPVAITAALVQELSHENIRSTATAFTLMMQNLIGMSLGPLLVAMLTQCVFQNDMYVGVSIAIVGMTFCILSVALFCHTQKQVL
jgi:MFS family permease